MGSVCLRRLLVHLSKVANTRTGSRKKCQTGVGLKFTLAETGPSSQNISPKWSLLKSGEVNPLCSSKGYCSTFLAPGGWRNPYLMSF